MVYKRYIKRGDKLFGPYYYESYRDEAGRTRTKIVGIPKKDKFSKLIYVLIAFSLILIAGFFILNNNFEKSSSIALEKSTLGNSKIIGNFIKLIGFGVESVEEQQEATEENIENVQETIEEPAESEIIENTPEIIEESPEIISEPEINQTNEIITENETLTNETEPNIIIEAPISTDSSQILNNSVTAQNISEQISQNISLINETLQNISEIVIFQENNFTINESTIQYSAKLGEPVKWKKTLKIDAGANSGKICTNSSIGDCQIKENKTLNNLEITLPKTAGNVSVVKIFANESVEELKVNVKNEKIISETEPVIFPQGMTPVSLITGQSVKNEDKKNIFKKIFKFFRNFFSLVGKVIDISENNEEVLVNIQEELEDEDEIEIEYYTEAPYSEEIIFDENYKKINVVGSVEVHYENILAFSNLSEEVLEEKIRLYRTTDGIKEQTGFTAYDNNNNNLIDYIEWIVPSLSNQTYEIILITKAQHLDSNRNFISDIYEQVKALDGNWSEQINDSEYVRVTFEKNLTNENDITIYPRAVSPRDDSGEPNGTPRIEVYEFNKTELIAEFTSIIDNEYNKVYLTALQGSQNVFDLKIVGGSVEFDYILDPFTGPSGGAWINLSGNDTGDWVGTSNVLSVAVNPNDNLVYTGLASGKFGMYNHSNGVWMNLSANDTGDWAGTSVVYSVAVNPNDNLVYTGLALGKFGVYNHSNGVWTNIVGTGISSVNSVAVNPNDNLVYTGLGSGNFRKYNNSNGVWMDLSANDTGNWAGTTHVISVAVNTNDNLVYTGLSSGKFGVYNNSNGIWMDLSANDTGDWAGTDAVNNVAVNTNNNLVYTILDSGKFGVYNHSNGVWMDLSGNDTGNWAGTEGVFSVAVNTNDNLVYTGLDSGKFGVYNNSNGVWMDLSGNDTGNWAGTNGVTGVATNPNDNLVYTGLDSGKFGVYRADLFSGGGAGTLASPYEISNCLQLQNMSLNLNANYELVNNIDCSDTINWNSGAGFAPIGTGIDIGASPFRGSLQGNDYNITDLYINNNTAQYVALFGYSVNSTINKVHLFNVFVSGGKTGSSLIVGGLAGAFDDNGTIANSSVHGNITSKGNAGARYTGGLSGWVWANKHLPKIYNSSFTGNISATGNDGTGGLVGWSDGIINYSFADVKLNSSNSDVGGLVGINAVDGADIGIIDNSYSTGNVSVIEPGTSSTRTGGLVGDNNARILHSYSIVNVSGTSNIGGLVGDSDSANSFILNSYACGNVNVKKSNGYGGGLIGYTDGGSSINYSYSAGILRGGRGVGGFVGSDKEGTGSYYNFSFWDYERAGGPFNDTGDGGNYSGIYADTTSQIRQQSTYTGWDFTNIWRIDEGYSYPYLKWQSGPVCGIIPHPIVSGGGSGNSVEIIELLSGFNVNPKKISVVLKPVETKTECFTISSTGTLSVSANLNTLGEIIPFTSLTNSVLNIPVAQSKTACAIFSADLLDIPKNYSGKIEVKDKSTKYIDVSLEIVNMTNATIFIFPFVPPTPIGQINITPTLPTYPEFPWIPPTPIGPISIIPTFPEFPWIPPTLVPGFPISIIPGFPRVPEIPTENISLEEGGAEKKEKAPAGFAKDIGNKIQETWKELPPAVKGVGIISLWILLLLLLIIYLTVRKFVKIQEQIQGYKSREEKLAAVENLKRESFRKTANFFEKIIDDGAIYLSEKSIASKNKKLKEIKKTELPAETFSKDKIEILSKYKTGIFSNEAREKYNSGAWLYSHRDYENALKEFERCIEIDNKFWQAYQGIGSCYLAQKKINQAIAAFEKSLKINPNNKELIEWMRKHKK